MAVISIYAIAKNEIKNVNRFMSSAKEADGVIILDTGSTDGTIERLRELGATVHSQTISPWRFDTARNISLSLVPNNADLCVCLDLDESIKPGWRAKLEAAYKDGITRFRYKYIWSWKANGTPDTIYNISKTHTRNNYIWRHPVHEMLYWTGPVSDEKFGYVDMCVAHYQDRSKSRSSYFPLLELAVKEDPNNDRNSHYLGREYAYFHRDDEAIVELKRHLSLPTAIWAPERAASMRFIADCYDRKKNQLERIKWLLRAVAEAPEFREPWVDLAQAYYDNKNFIGGYYAAKHALNIKVRQLTFNTKGYAWGAKPHDLASICAFRIGLKDESLKLAEEALELEKEDTRLQNNIDIIKKALNK